jgi:RND family efflux transporter MFP subunit
MKKLLLLVLFLAILVIASLLLTDKQHPVKVRAAKAQIGMVQELVLSKSAATVEANRTANMSARIQGKIVRIFVRENGRVDSGQTVLQLETDNLEAQKNKIMHDIVSLKRRIDQTEINVKRTGNELSRLKPLLGSAVPKSQVDNLEKEMEMAQKDKEVLEASLMAAYSSLDIVQIELRNTTVTAPFVGFITRLMVEEGELVIPGTPLFTMIDAEEPRLVAPVDEADIAQIRLGQTALIKFDATPETTNKGRVSEIYKAASVEKRNERTINIKIQLNEIPTFMRVGMSANVEIIIRQKPEALIIPTYLIYEDRHLNTKFVYTVRQGVVVKLPIKTGLWNWDVSEVTEGLAVGEMAVYSIEETGLHAGVKAEVLDGP